MNPYISQFDEEFDAEKSSQYKMAIQFSLGGLSYALFDTETQVLVALECYQSDLLADGHDLFRTLERALESKGLNNKKFFAVTCLVSNRFCSLVPEPLFNETDASEYLGFSFQITDNHSIEFDYIESASCFNVYALPKTLHDLLVAKWKDAHVVHASTIFVESTMKDNEGGVFVHVNNRDFDMMVKTEGKLVFFNNFKFNTKEDFAYFLLYAMEQNGIPGQNTTVCFSGLIRPASKVIDLCGRYIKDIRFAEDPHTLQVSKALKEVPFQYYHTLYQAMR